MILWKEKICRVQNQPKKIMKKKKQTRQMGVKDYISSLEINNNSKK